MNATRSYDAILDDAKKAQSCKRRHSCARREHIMREWYNGSVPNDEHETCAVCDAYEKRKVAVAQGKQPSFLVVAYGINRVYLGPEEGGRWGDAIEVLEVRRAFTFEQGLRHMRELKSEYAQPRYDRFSCANRGEPDIFFQCVYSEADPRMPHDHYPSRECE